MVKLHELPTVCEPGSPKSAPFRSAAAPARFGAATASCHRVHAVHCVLSGGLLTGSDRMTVTVGEPTMVAFPPGRGWAMIGSVRAFSGPRSATGANAKDMPLPRHIPAHFLARPLKVSRIRKSMSNAVSRIRRLRAQRMSECHAVAVRTSVAKALCTRCRSNKPLWCH